MAHSVIDTAQVLKKLLKHWVVKKLRHIFLILLLEVLNVAYLKSLMDGLLYLVASDYDYSIINFFYYKKRNVP